MHYYYYKFIDLIQDCIKRKSELFKILYYSFKYSNWLLSTYLRTDALYKLLYFIAVVYGSNKTSFFKKKIIDNGKKYIFVEFLLILLFKKPDTSSGPYFTKILKFVPKTNLIS